MDLGAARVKQAPRFRLKPVLQYVRWLASNLGCCGASRTGCCEAAKGTPNYVLRKAVGILFGRTGYGGGRRRTWLSILCYVAR